MKKWYDEEYEWEITIRRIGLYIGLEGIIVAKQTYGIIRI